MIQLIKCVRRFSTLSSSTVTDPYMILGVQRKADFEEIKTEYFKLAAKYHPDINKSPDATA